MSTPPPTQPATFEENERVLAHHQGLIYEAKVLSVELRQDPTKKIEGGKKKPYYQIHYQGWNDRWDEWVDDTRILKYNDENKEIQTQIRAEYRRNKNSKRRERKGNFSPTSFIKS